MKNYFKVVVAGKNVGIFVFEDQDEASMRTAFSSAETIARPYGGKIVVWSLSGLTPKYLAVVGQTFEFNGHDKGRFDTGDV